MELLGEDDVLGPSQRLQVIDSDDDDEHSDRSRSAEFRCRQCGRLLSNKSNLTKHERRGNCDPSTKKRRKQKRRHARNHRHYVKVVKPKCTLQRELKTQECFICLTVPTTETRHGLNCQHRLCVGCWDQWMQSIDDPEFATCVVCRAFVNREIMNCMLCGQVVKPPHYITPCRHVLHQDCAHT